MGMKLKKFWPLVGAMCVGLLTPSFADNYQYGGSSHTTSESMQKIDQGTTKRGAYREITPAAGPKVTHGIDVFIGAECLYWRTVQEGSVYINASGFKNNFFPKDQDASVGKQLSVGQDWKTGFRVIGGMNFDHDDWDFCVQYTEIRPRQHKDTEIGRTNNIIEYPAYPGPNLNLGQVPSVRNLSLNAFPIHRATADWYLRHRTLDMSIGRNCYLSSYVTYRPSMGIKAITQIHNMNMVYYNYVQGFYMPRLKQISFSGPYTVHEQFDVSGVGLRIGCNMAYYLIKSLCLYSDLHLSTLWVNHHNYYRKDDVDDIKPPIKVVANHLDKSKYVTNKYVTELEAGLRWGLWFYDDGCHLEVQLGWTQQNWFNWTNFINFYSSEVWSDLSFSGANFKVRFVW